MTYIKFFSISNTSLQLFLMIFLSLLFIIFSNLGNYSLFYIPFFPCKHLHLFFLFILEFLSFSLSIYLSLSQPFLQILIFFLCIFLCIFLFFFHHCDLPKLILSKTLSLPTFAFFFFFSLEKCVAFLLFWFSIEGQIKVSFKKRVVWGEYCMNERVKNEWEKKLEG